MFDFKKIEPKILKFWKNNRIFQKSVEQRKNAKPFVFYEGPPTANGMPGIHHVIARSFKDLYGRYKAMRGFFVLRRAGWDTHGLPVEIEVEKSLGLKNKKDIETFGIAKFNKRCRESVWKYKDEWEKMTEQMGYWIDMQNPYVTCTPEYIESVWWLIKQISNKKLLYLGHKVLPYCTRCGTPLSSHEVAQGYKDIAETSVYIKFKIKKQGSPFDKASVLVWTTTPWTLPGNIALAVGADITYAEITHGSERLILAKDLIKNVGENIKIIKEFKGQDLIGLKYEPLFDISALTSKAAHQIYPAKFVTTQEGTGVVHTAAMYGVDDYEFGKEFGLPMHHTVDEQGKFTKDVPEFCNQYVKDAEPGIIEYLRKKNLLFKTEMHSHTYPFCWRCDTPLLYYAKNSWFIKMSSLQKRLMKNNEDINWVPEHMKDGRFGEFIKEAKDWALSRERYWATPLPIWQCERCQEILVIGSLEELEKNRYCQKNTYYLMRHGESTKNGTYRKDEGIIASRLEHDNYDLTLNGIAQVKEAARKLKKSGGVDLIISSPFLRTKHTARIISEYLGIKFKTDKRIKEMDFGFMYEGKSVSAFQTNAVKDFSTKRGDGESWSDLKIRIISLIKELEKNNEGKKILLVSHGDPIWMIDGLSKNYSDDYLIGYHENNYPKEGQLSKAEFKNLPLNDEGDLDLHRPYVDEIYLKCPKCKGRMKRVPELADVWFDSGAMPIAQWHYPFENKRLIDGGTQYPADYVCEAIDQTRGWFYTLLAIATATGRKTPYNNVIVLGHVLDSQGKKMSKSKGNIITPDQVMSKVGSDATRWFFFANTTPGDPKPVTVKDFEIKYFGFISTLMNSLRFFQLYVHSHKQQDEFEPKTILDKWIDGRLKQLITEITADLDGYNPTNAARKIEDFVINDFSNWWVRRSRKRFQRSQDEAEIVYVSSFLKSILIQLSKILAPFTPFVAEEMHLVLHSGVKLEKESVHLSDWPNIYKPELINTKLIEEMAELRKFVALGLAVRKTKQIKVRQPLAGISLKRVNKFDPGLEELLLEELNVKKIGYDQKQTDDIVLDERLSPDLIHEGYAREIIRKIQDMRKEAKYKLDEKVIAHWDSLNPEMTAVIERYSREIANDTQLLDFSRRHHEEKAVYDIEQELELAPQMGVWFGLKSQNAH